jgi:methyl-accepting chemotaxis protein
LAGSIQHEERATTLTNNTDFEKDNLTVLDSPSANFSEIKDVEIAINRSSQAWREQQELEQRRGFIHILDLAIGLICTIVGSLVGVLLLSVTHIWTGWVLIGVCGVGAIFYVVSYVLTNPHARLNVGQVSAANYVLVYNMLFILAASNFLLGCNLLTSACFILVPIVAGITGMSRPAIVVASIITAGAMTIFYSLQWILQIYTPPVLIDEYPLLTLPAWLMFFSMVVISISIFVQRIKSFNSQLTAQSAQLIATLQTLQVVNSSASGMSQTMFSVASDLTQTANQQANGSTEQAAAIVVVTSGLAELTDTNEQISTSIRHVTVEANQTLELVYEVKDSSENVNKFTNDGEQALGRLVRVIEAVRNRIEVLAQRLLVLTERSKEIGNIIDLMRDLADETHMLALNAAIESADGKAGSGDGGRRFGVIAGEVKNLADRSLESAQEVQKIINEVQGAIATAVLAAEEGKKETLRAVNETAITNKVIMDLGMAVNTTLVSVARIVLATETVARLAEEIGLASQQQRSASSQILTTMQTVRHVAQENAAVVGQISATISNITDKAEELHEVLLKTASDNDDDTDQ